MPATSILLPTGSRALPAPTHAVPAVVDYFFKVYSDLVGVPVTWMPAPAMP